MEQQNLSVILQAAIVTCIEVLLPLFLGYSVALLNKKIQQAKGQIDHQKLATAVALVQQFVAAAEQNGLTGALKAEGAAKKQYVIDMMKAELDRRGIHLDIETIDALIEAEVNQVFGKIDLSLDDLGISTN